MIATARTALALCVPLALVAACSVREVDRRGDGLFPCDAATDCPAGLSCILGGCYDAEGPQVEILNPEVEQAFTANGEPTLTVTFKLGGTGLEMVDPASDPDQEVGMGHVVVLVDGEEQMMFESGALETGATAELTVPNQPGGHHIVAVARLSSGVNYDNEGAVASRLFWVDDGEPHIAFKQPLAGAAFSLDAQLIEIEVAVINFVLRRTDVDPAPMSGHAHIHYDKVFPACTDDLLCDADYFGIIAPEGPASSALGVGRIPASAAGVATLTAVLRVPAHFPFRTEDGQPVFRDLQIERSPAVPGPDADNEDGELP